jgi:hypothetical protein
MGLMEGIYSLRTRRFRLAPWAAFAAAGASIAVWMPLIHAVNSFNAGDTGSPAYYAAPTLERLIQSYVDLLLGSTAAVLILFAGLLAGRIGRPADGTQGADAAPEPAMTGFWSIVIGLVLLPVLVFAFGWLVTGTYNERYVIAAAIGAGGLIAAAARTTRAFRRIVPWVILAAGALTLTKADRPAKDYSEVLAKLSGDIPIVVADGLQFFPLEESAPPKIRARIRYVTLPQGTAVGDPTNQHQIERWKAINPALPVRAVTEFVKETPDYYVVDFRTSDDTPAWYLFNSGKTELVDAKLGALIFRSCPRAQSPQR